MRPETLEMLVKLIKARTEGSPEKIKELEAEMTAYLVKMRAELVNFTKAMIEGVHRYKADKEFSMKVLAKYMKVQDREVLEENFREYDFPTRPYPAKEYFELPIQEIAKKDPKILKENPERYSDMSLVKDIEASGFIDKLSQEYKVK